MKKLLKLNFIIYFIIVLALVDIVFLIISLVSKIIDLFLIELLVASLVILLVINTRSANIYKNSRNDDEEQKNINIKRKSFQKYYWLLFLLHLISLIVIYIFR